jgi:hypothetical protein
VSEYGNSPDDLADAANPEIPPWKAALRKAADEAYQRNPGPGELRPEVVARLRRSMFPSWRRRSG